MIHRELKIIYKNNKPYGIRDENGFLLFFPVIQKYPNQEMRYKQETEEQCRLAEYLLASLQTWAESEGVR